nr:uncharacterized protein LOC124806923 [Hydra vulgaris]
MYANDKCYINTSGNIQTRIRRTSAKRQSINVLKSEEKELSSDLYSFNIGVGCPNNNAAIKPVTSSVILQLPVALQSFSSQPNFSLQSPVTTSEKEELEMNELRNERDSLKIKNIELKLTVFLFSLEALKQNPSFCMMLTELNYKVL